MLSLKTLCMIYDDCFFLNLTISSRELKKNQSSNHPQASEAEAEVLRPLQLAKATSSLVELFQNWYWQSKYFQMFLNFVRSPTSAMHIKIKVHNAGKLSKWIYNKIICIKAIMIIITIIVSKHNIDNLKTHSNLLRFFSFLCWLTQ